MLQILGSAVIVRTYSRSRAARLSLWAGLGALHLISIKGIVQRKNNKARVSPAVMNVSVRQRSYFLFHKWCDLVKLVTVK